MSTHSGTLRKCSAELKKDMDEAWKVICRLKDRSHMLTELQSDIARKRTAIDQLHKVQKAPNYYLKSARTLQLHRHRIEMVMITQNIIQNVIEELNRAHADYKAINEQLHQCQIELTECVNDFEKFRSSMIASKPKVSLLAITLAGAAFGGSVGAGVGAGAGLLGGPLGLIAGAAGSIVGAWFGGKGGYYLGKVYNAQISVEYKHCEAKINSCINSIDENRKEISEITKTINSMEHPRGWYKDEKIKELKEEAELEDYSLYAYPILPGINVADENKKKIPKFSSENTVSFIYNGEKGSLNWKENGLVLLFEDSELPEDAKCPLSVSVGEADAFRYPDTVEPASKVYHIDCPKNLHVSVKIRIYHNVPEHNIQHLCFVTGSENQPPYDYTIVHGGYFTSKYGEVNVRKFSWYALAILRKYRVKGLLSLMEESCVASMYCSMNPRHNSYGFSWSIYISVMKNCSIFKNLINNYIKEEYKDDVKMTSSEIVHINSSESSVTVIPHCEHKEVNLKPSGRPSIQKIDIKRFVDARPPHIKFTLYTKRHCLVPPMNIFFTFQGLEEQDIKLNLDLDISESPSKIFPAPAERNRSFSSSGGPTVYDFTLKNLTVLECGRTRCKVHLIDEIKSKWKIASDLLGLTISRIEGIEKDHHSVQECCRSLMAEWLTNVDGIYEYPPSWEGLCNLLNDMNLSALSEQVRNIIFRSEC